MSSSDNEETSRGIDDEERSDGSEHAVVEMGTACPPQNAHGTLLPQPFAMRKGSRTELSSTTTQLFDSKSAHNKKLYSRGVMKMKKARTIRRQIRDKVATNCDTKQLHPKLESSSSSESESSENSDWERETVDWQALAHESWWAKECLFGIMPVQEISSLVGWATHHTHDGTVATTETPHSESANEKTMIDIPSQDDGTNDEGANSTVIDARCSAGLEDNPLLFLPNVPLPPSYLHYLTEKAREYVESPIQNRDRWKSHTFLASSDTSDDEKTLETRYKPKDWQQWEYDSEDETYQATKELLRKRKRLVTMHIPYPSAQIAPKTKKASETKKAHLFKSLDDSALVALGIVWEEMMTASLLPLAQQHVARCRRLVHNSVSFKSSDDVVHTTDPFQEWTLPPEQAIWRLANEGVTTAVALPTMYPPTTFPYFCFDRETSVSSASLIQHLGNAEQRMQRAVDNWCHSHALDPAFVSNNMDIFGVFLPCTPTVRPRKPPVTDREREERNDKLDRKRKKLKIGSEQTKVAEDESSLDSN